MSEKILSQEEIEALYSAMSDGQIDTDPERGRKAETEATPYVLYSQQSKMEGHFEVLEEVYDKYSLLVRDTLSTKLKSASDTDFISTEIVKFREFLKRFSRPTCFNVFNMEPFHGSALLVITAPLFFSLIDSMFGGTGKPLARVREFTQIEKRVMQRLVLDILKNLEKAWEVVQSVRTVFRKMESNPDYIRMIAPDDLVVAAGFIVRRNSYEGHIYVCMPYLMIEPVKEKLTYGSLSAADSGNSPDPRMKAVLKSTFLNVSAELGRATCTVRNLLRLKVGDTIKLNTGPNVPIPVKIENSIKYKGYPGVYYGNQAVRIAEIHSEKMEDV
ncbi:flagellar motor switch protein FliM [Desulfococcus sp.]|uniref:flagellar motor switch protein FliM n=1 Tax=Desulfococcus sp. TaxID=2025834 RepID=UPI003593EEE7